MAMWNVILLMLTILLVAVRFWNSRLFSLKFQFFFLLVVSALKRAHLFQYEVFNLGNNTPLGVLELVSSLEKHLGMHAAMVSDCFFQVFVGKTAEKNFVEQAKGDVLVTFAE